MRHENDSVIKINPNTINLFIKNKFFPILLPVIKDVVVINNNGTANIPPFKIPSML